MHPEQSDHSIKTAPAASPSVSLTLFLCGDVMTGRGIDQVLPHPSDRKSVV